MKNVRLAILIVVSVLVLDIVTAMVLPTVGLNFISGMIYGYIGATIYLKKTQHLY